MQSFIQRQLTTLDLIHNIDIRLRRALPIPALPSLGPFVFVDHYRIQGPRGIGDSPHPHAGIEDVSCLLEGGVRHRDSMGFATTSKPAMVLSEVRWPPQAVGGLAARSEGHAVEPLHAAGDHHQPLVAVGDCVQARHAERLVAGLGELKLEGQADPHLRTVPSTVRLFGVEHAAPGADELGIGLRRSQPPATQLLGQSTPPVICAQTDDLPMQHFALPQLQGARPFISP